ncbi:MULTISPECIES: YgjV family protein [Shewanella]|uniref:YgjV family protein n=1 Tax=Shewanella polaris TaxID=2588449 RepID=A0A4Y5YBR3_9GAMM|nr:MULTISPECIES: YgjV family protein [Shewanella]QDE29983.1 YgjV family protein [Shewanella polaris]
MDSINIWEWVGYLASVVVAISLMMSNIKKLRWWNLLGAGLFVAYGLAIDAIPVALVNFFIVLIDAYYLVKLYRDPPSPPE